MKNKIKNIVTIGGGTGSFVVLSALKNISNIKLNAIVAMTDDGGSTGVLMDELGVLPAGDVRQCLIALSEDSLYLRKILSYRFENGGLKGHNFGNIFLAALEKVSGSFINGIEEAHHILRVSGKVIPVINKRANLCALLKNDKVLKGENEINHFDISEIGIKKMYIEQNVSINKDAKKAILEADYIFIGPGNHYCSIIPNLIVSGFKSAIQKSNAKIIYISNLTNKKNHTENYKLSDYVFEIEKYIDKKIDFILFNNEKPNIKTLNYYKQQEGDTTLIENDMNYDHRIILENILSKKIYKQNKADKIANTRSLIRHDSNKLKNIFEKIIFYNKELIQEKNLKNKDKNIYVFDFDNTIFDLKKYKKEVLFKVVDQNIFIEFGENIKKNKKHFNLDLFLNFVKNKYNHNLNEIEVKSILKNKIKNYIKKDYLDFLSKNKKENNILLSTGDFDYQNFKIKNSGIQKFFKKIYIVKENKQEYLKSFLKDKKYKNKNFFFFDDKVKNFILENKDIRLFQFFTGDENEISKEEKDILIKNKIKILGNKDLFEI